MASRDREAAEVCSAGVGSSDPSSPSSKMLLVASDPASIKVKEAVVPLAEETITRAEVSETEGTTTTMAAADATPITSSEVYSKSTNCKDSRSSQHREGLAEG